MTLRIDLSHIAQVADQLDALLGGDDDERLFHDMLVGETDIDAIVSRIHSQLARDEELLAGISVREASLKERRQRIANRRDAAKSLIGKVMRAGHLLRIELPEVTYSVRDGKPSLKVVDADAVPENLCRFKSEPDKTKINEAFANVEELPNWLIRDLPKDVVTARTK